MRFTLDNDVDHALIGWISKQMGHDCFPTPGELSDDDVAVYADDKGAVLLSHDAAFALRRRSGYMQFGMHVHLSMEQPIAVQVLSGVFDDLVAHLAPGPPIVLRVHTNGSITRL